MKTVFQHNYDFITEASSCRRIGNDAVIRTHTFRGNSADVVISVLSDMSFRFRMYPAAGRQSVGDCVGETNEIVSFTGIPDYSLLEDEEHILITMKRMTVEVCKRPWDFKVYRDDRLLLREQQEDFNVDGWYKRLPLGFDCNDRDDVIRVRESLYLHSDEELYGFGERFTGFLKRGQRIHYWQKDALSTNTEDAYKTHPYFYSSRGYSMLVNSYSRMEFDTGAGSAVTITVEVEDSVLDYAVFCGGDARSCLREYIRLTGPGSMIPRWALGTWMSRCAYRCQEEVMDMVTSAAQNDIALDVINLDAWQSMERMGEWQWDRTRFPDPENMIQTLREMGIRICLWIFPYIHERASVFEYARRREFLVRNREGQPAGFVPIAGMPGKMYAFDFSNPEFCEWYEDMAKQVLSMGIGAVKTDFSEAVPEDTVYYDGKDGIRGHNRYPCLYAGTVYRMLKHALEGVGEPAMIWSRSGGPLSRATPGAWGGDSSSSLNNHACLLHGGLSLAVSGISFWGFDMGGFFHTGRGGEEIPPTALEYIRSVEFGFFCPLCRCHGKTWREPWHYGERALKIFRYYNRLRHRLLPYLNSMSWKFVREFLPVMRPMLLEFEQDPAAAALGEEYMLGESLLVAPVFDQAPFRLYLPNGRWADFFTGEIVEGGRWIARSPALEEIPVYLRENHMTVFCNCTGNLAQADLSELTVLIHLQNRMEAVYETDEGAYCLRAWLEGDCLMVETDMAVKSIRFYGSVKLRGACLNGLPATVSQEPVGSMIQEESV